MRGSRAGGSKAQKSGVSEGRRNDGGEPMSTAGSVQGLQTNADD